jgi:hypothetical protein
MAGGCTELEREIEIARHVKEPGRIAGPKAHGDDDHYQRSARPSNFRGFPHLVDPVVKTAIGIPLATGTFIGTSQTVLESTRLSQSTDDYDTQGIRYRSERLLWGGDGSGYFGIGRNT